MNRTIKVAGRGALLAAAALGAGPQRASGQFNIKISDSANVHVGVLLQQWTDWNKTNATPDSSYAQNMYLRRARFLVGGNINPRLSFFYELDAANLGRATPALSPPPLPPAALAKQVTQGQSPVFTQDAYFEYRLSGKQEALLDAGLILVPLCRNCLNSAASLLSLDYGNYSFVESAPTQSVVGRDLGTQLRGYVLDQRLEYRIGLYSGARNFQAANPFRSVGRLQYDFLSTEVAPTSLTYAGTYFGKKPVFAVGTGYDVQQDYKAYSVDAFLDHPVGTDAITLTADYIHYDGGTTLAALPKQDTYFIEGGYYFSGLRLMPFGRFEGRSADATTATNQQQKRYQLGATYYAEGHNFNVKGAFNRNSLDVLNAATNDQNEFTVQLQAFVF